MSGSLPPLSASSGSGGSSLLEAHHFRSKIRRNHCFVRTELACMYILSIVSPIGGQVSSKSILRPLRVPPVARTPIGPARRPRAAAATRTTAAGAASLLASALARELWRRTPERVREDAALRSLADAEAASGTSSPCPAPRRTLDPGGAADGRRRPGGARRPGPRPAPRRRRRGPGRRAGERPRGRERPSEPTEDPSTRTGEATPDAENEERARGHDRKGESDPVKPKATHVDKSMIAKIFFPRNNVEVIWVTIPALLMLGMTESNVEEGNSSENVMRPGWKGNSTVGVVCVSASDGMCPSESVEAKLVHDSQMQDVANQRPESSRYKSLQTAKRRPSPPGRTESSCSGGLPGSHDVLLRSVTAAAGSSTIPEQPREDPTTPRRDDLLRRWP